MKRFRWHLIALAIIVLLGVSPLIPVLVSGLIADAAGCRVDESGPRPCVILGIDLGGTLSTMYVLGWLGLVTIPAAGFLLLPWAGWVGLTMVRRLARR